MFRDRTVPVGQASSACRCFQEQLGRASVLSRQPWRSHAIKRPEDAFVLTQCKQLTELRQEPEYAAIFANIQRWTLLNLDRSFKAFFRRLKVGEDPGYPRFKGKGRWRSFGLAKGNSITLPGRRLYIKGVAGGLRVNIHRVLCAANLAPAQWVPSWPPVSNSSALPSLSASCLFCGGRC